MPDDEDYRAMAALLARPRSWSQQQRRTVEFGLDQQRQMLAAVHPKDERGRKRLADVIEQFEAAIEQADRA